VLAVANARNCTEPCSTIVVEADITLAPDQTLAVNGSVVILGACADAPCKVDGGGATQLLRVSGYYGYAEVSNLEFANGKRNDASKGVFGGAGACQPRAATYGMAAPPRWLPPPPPRSPGLALVGCPPGSSNPLRFAVLRPSPFLSPPFLAACPCSGGLPAGQGHLHQLQVHQQQRGAGRRRRRLLRCGAGLGEWDQPLSSRLSGTRAAPLQCSCSASQAAARPWLPAQLSVRSLLSKLSWEQDPSQLCLASVVALLPQAPRPTSPAASLWTTARRTWAAPSPSAARCPSSRTAPLWPTARVRGRRPGQQ
jgi:hypothetical protein